MSLRGYYIKLPDDNPKTLLKGLEMLSKQRYASELCFHHNFESIYRGSHYGPSSKDYLVCFDGIVQPEIFSEPQLQKVIEGRHEDFIYDVVAKWKELYLNYKDLGEL